MIAPRRDSILEHLLGPAVTDLIRDHVREDDIVQGRCPICCGPITIRCDAHGPYFYCACRSAAKNDGRHMETTVR